MRETRVRSLGRRDPLEKEMATHSSTLAWKPHGWRSLVGYSPRGCKESDTTERLHIHVHSKQLKCLWNLSVFLTNYKLSFGHHYAALLRGMLNACHFVLHLITLSAVAKNTLSEQPPAWPGLTCRAGRCQTRLIHTRSTPVDSFTLRPRDKSYPQVSHWVKRSTG